MTRQYEILQVFMAIEARHGIPPTSRELAKEVGISNTAAVKHLKRLVDKGLLRHAPNVSRGISSVPVESIKISKLTSAIKVIELHSKQLMNLIAAAKEVVKLSQPGDCKQIDRLRDALGESCVGG